MKIVTDAGYHGYVGIEYEGSKLSEHEGIIATKKLLESLKGPITPVESEASPMPTTTTNEFGVHSIRPDTSPVLASLARLKSAYSSKTSMQWRGVAFSGEGE